MVCSVLVDTGVIIGASSWPDSCLSYPCGSAEARDWCQGQQHYKFPTLVVGRLLEILYLSEFGVQ